MKKLEQTQWEYMIHIDQMSSSDLHDLMNAFGQDVWNLAFILTRRHDLADDIAQDVFLKAYSSIHTFRGHSAIKTWLLSITRNTSLNYLRSAFVRKVTLFEWINTKESSPSAEQKVMEYTFSSEIWDTVLKLPIKLREVLILHAKYEMTTKEIAAMLQLSEGTVKSRLSRARGRMAAYRKESALYE
ncbi:RNA polymerase sigma factor [Paenibacillus sp. SN-8-1]|uniref:RNA polymerase sigma factor n=1 Tax=Paenibacillus sp. SN-8-1 TaxID=3435409 RepID=UPI003D9A7208